MQRTNMEDNSGAALGIVFLVLFALFVFLVGPFILIWAVNTVFGLAIVSSWTNWFCVGLILFLIRGSSSSKS